MPAPGRFREETLRELRLLRLAAGFLRDTFFPAGDFFPAGFFLNDLVFLPAAVLGFERFLLVFFLADITVSLSPTWFLICVHLAGICGKILVMAWLGCDRCQPVYNQFPKPPENSFLNLC